jgi:hypothetical protein
MGEIIRKIYYNIDKTKVVYDIYYFGNTVSSQMQNNGVLIQLLISGMDSLNALARKTKEIEAERKKISIKYLQMNFLRIHKGHSIIMLIPGYSNFSHSESNKSQ